MNRELALRFEAALEPGETLRWAGCIVEDPESEAKSLVWLSAATAGVILLNVLLAFYSRAIALLCSPVTIILYFIVYFGHRRRGACLGITSRRVLENAAFHPLSVPLDNIREIRTVSVKEGKGHLKILVEHPNCPFWSVILYNHSGYLEAAAALRAERPDIPVSIGTTDYLVPPRS